MKFSYRLKLTLIITSLSVMLTSVCMILYYNYTYDIIMDSISKNLRDAAQLIRISFSDSDIERVERLKAQLEPYIHYSDKELKDMQNGEVINNVPKDVINIIQASDDFQYIAKKFQRIVIATWHVNSKSEPVWDKEKNLDYFQKGVIAPYIVFLSDKYWSHRIVQNLVSGGYEPSKDWSGNPIGTSWYTTISDKAVNSYPTYVADHIVTDSFYSSLYSSTALYGKNGKVTAYLEVDYPAGPQLDKLKHVRMLSYILISLSFFLSLGLSLYISKRMSASLNKLSAAAAQIKESNYNVQVDISNNDEFGVLGNTFNQMAKAVKKTTSELKDSNERLMSLTADMHDGVGAVLTSIQIATLSGSETDMESIHHLADAGIGEIRFLMDAMEYQHCDFELLSEGVELIAVDILRPNNVVWKVDTRETENIELQFQMYLDIQRIAREAFANIIKHSDASKCLITLYADSGFLFMNIKDNGKPLDSPMTESGGKGLNNMKHRAERYYGSFNFKHGDDGAEISISMKISED